MLMPMSEVEVVAMVMAAEVVVDIPEAEVVMVMPGISIVASGIVY